MSSNPGRIRSELAVTLDRPRDRRSPAFEALVDEIYGIMTDREEAPPAAARATPTQSSAIDEPLPAATVGGMAGLLETSWSPAAARRPTRPRARPHLRSRRPPLPPRRRRPPPRPSQPVDNADIPTSPTTDANSVVSDILTTKQLFARKAAEHAPLVRAINNALVSSMDGNLPEGFFLDILRRGFSDEEARHQLDIAIDWGRYGELYEYDANTGQIHRESAADASTSS